MILLYKLLASHMIGDYVLQSDFIAKTKGENWWHLISHSITYTVPFALLMGIDIKIGLLLFSHILIDATKAKWRKINYASDQVLHIWTLILLYLIY